MPTKRKPPARLGDAFSDDEQAVRDRLNKVYAPVRVSGWPNVPEHAPPFRPDTPTNNPTVAKFLRLLEQMAPEMRGTSPRYVRVGPTLGSMDIMEESDLPLDAFAGTTLQGVYKHGDAGIGISPSELSDEASLADTILHELSHARGAGERGAAEIGPLAPKALGLKPYSNTNQFSLGFGFPRKVSLKDGR